MDTDELKKLLDRFKNGSVTLDDTLQRLRQLPYEDLGFAKVDHHRAMRSGFPEVVFCQGKTVDQVVQIFQSLEKNTDRILLTRAAPEYYEAIKAIHPEAQYNELGRIIYFNGKPPQDSGYVPIICAGTADIPVAEEAFITAQVCGANPERLFDVGVAGVHRLLDHIEHIQRATCIVCIAGMEGALPSVVGGLAPCPVIAVPTSVGYGTHLNGLVPLFGMLNSCASTVTVVNIDNGFSAGYIAAMIARNSK
ncbi:nickel pincer cofactor biosynthesis protein LarB [Verrucomicrobiota bacterium]